jgi:hypothetical protein
MDCAGDQTGTGGDYCCGHDSGVTSNPLLCGEDSSGNRCIDASLNRFCRVMPRVQACCGDALCEGGETDAVCGTDCLDTDGDSFPDVVDSDDDADSVPDRKDVFPHDPTEWLDADGDGMGNNADTDDDNDSWLDTLELAAGSDPFCDISIPGASGDGNGDLQVNIADTAMIYRVLLGTYTPTLAEQQRLNVAPLRNGVPNPDCSLNAGDLLGGLRKALGLTDFQAFRDAHPDHRHDGQGK